MVERTFFCFSMCWELFKVYDFYLGSQSSWRGKYDSSGEWSIGRLAREARPVGGGLAHQKNASDFSFFTFPPPRLFPCLPAIKATEHIEWERLWGFCMARRVGRLTYIWCLGKSRYRRLSKVLLQFSVLCNACGLERFNFRVQNTLTLKDMLIPPHPAFNCLFFFLGSAWVCWNKCWEHFNHIQEELFLLCCINLQ